MSEKKEAQFCLLREDMTTLGIGSRPKAFEWFDSRAEARRRKKELEAKRGSGRYYYLIDRMKRGPRA